MFSKPKVQKGIPRPKRLVSTTAETQQQPTLIRNRGRASKERGSEEGEKRELKVGKLRKKQSAYRIANRMAQYFKFCIVNVHISGFCIFRQICLAFSYCTRISISFCVFYR
jgi:hypothetical protein